MKLCQEIIADEQVAPAPGADNVTKPDDAILSESSLPGSGSSRIRRQNQARALITGASEGMGFDTAKEFISEKPSRKAGRKCRCLIERSRLDVHGMAQALGVSEGKAA